MTKKEIELPVIPQFVADYVELFKDENPDYCFELIIHNWGCFPSKVKFWISDPNYEEHRKQFIRAIIDGYEIEKTKKYLIKSPLIDDEGDFQYVNRTSDNNTYQWEYFKYAFTMEEIENSPQLRPLKQFAVEVENEK